MKIRKQSVAAAVIMSLALPAAATLMVTTSATPAFAKSGNGNGNGNSGNNGNGGGATKTKTTGNAGKTNQGGNGQGAVRSVLGGANASNASPTALEHASDNSRVGKARIFRDTYLAAQTAEANLGPEAQSVYGGYSLTPPSYTSAEKQAEIDALVAPMADSYITEEYPDGLENPDYITAVNDYNSALGALQAEHDAATAYEAQAGVDDALMALTGGRTLTDDAMNQLLANLGL